MSALSKAGWYKVFSCTDYDRVAKMFYHPPLSLEKCTYNFFRNAKKCNMLERSMWIHLACSYWLISQQTPNHCSGEWHIWLKVSIISSPLLYSFCVLVPRFPFKIVGYKVFWNSYWKSPHSSTLEWLNIVNSHITFDNGCLKSRQNLII